MPQRQLFPILINFHPVNHRQLFWVKVFKKSANPILEIQANSRRIGPSTRRKAISSGIPFPRRGHTLDSMVDALHVIVRHAAQIGLQVVTTVYYADNFARFPIFAPAKSYSQLMQTVGVLFYFR